MRKNGFGAINVNVLNVMKEFVMSMNYFFFIVKSRCKCLECDVALFLLLKYFYKSNSNEENHSIIKK